MKINKSKLGHNLFSCNRNSSSNNCKETKTKKERNAKLFLTKLRLHLKMKVAILSILLSTLCTLTSTLVAYSSDYKKPPTPAPAKPSGYSWDKIYPETSAPKNKPTWSPSHSPTWSPTYNPTWSPTWSPTYYPTYSPTWSPTYSKEDLPTYSPTYYPTPYPSNAPTYPPTYYVAPTDYPTYYLTYSPTYYPTYSPTYYPTYSPTCPEIPTDYPTYAPDTKRSPTEYPEYTTDPTVSPTKYDSANSVTPSYSPTYVPTCVHASTYQPTYKGNPPKERTFSPTKKDYRTDAPIYTEEPTTAPLYSDKPTNKPTKFKNVKKEEYYDLEDGLVQIYLAIDDLDETITVEYTYQGRSWIGFGFSENGTMIGSTAVIGMESEGLPVKYFLDFGWDNAIRAPNERQTLTEVDYKQNSTHTYMKFTKPLIEADEPEILKEGRNKFIYAYGSDNEYGVEKKQGELDMVVTSTESELESNTSGTKATAFSWTITILLGVVISLATA